MYGQMNRQVCIRFGTGPAITEAAALVACLLHYGASSTSGHLEVSIAQHQAADCYQHAMQHAQQAC